MSVGYMAVGWNRQKRVYDTALAVGVEGFVAEFYLESKLIGGGGRAGERSADAARG